MRLLLITPPTTQPGELLVARRLLDAGAPLLHVRKPDATVSELRAYLLQFEAHHRRQVVLHTHHELAVELGCKVGG
jgi:thiamine-phosphate pyrophosphorylase